METAEEIIRRKALETGRDARLSCVLAGQEFKRDPPYARLSIGGLTPIERRTLTIRYGGGSLLMTRGEFMDELIWALHNREPKRLQSYYEILPILKGTKNYKYAINVLCQELGIQRLGPNGMYRYLKDNPGEPWERWDAWIKERRKLFPHGMGEE